MKDETASKPIKVFCGLCFDMYSLLVDRKEKKTAKGIKKYHSPRPLPYCLPRRFAEQEGKHSSYKPLLKTL